MTGWGAITWDVARAGGFVAYGLVTVSIALGLVLSLRWKSKAWPRWATTDLHRYITLLALVFTGVHTLGIWLDPFMAFGPAEVFVPLASHYRPIWVALGIVAAYLLLAIWLSERIQKRIGYAWWRRLHYLTFAIYGLVTIHGIGTGSDTRTTWALAIYAGSFALIGSLLAIRLLLPAPHLTPRPRVATGVVLLAAGVALWTVAGPLRPGWNAVANFGHGSGARIALASGSRSSASAARAVVPFSASLQGTVGQNSGDGGLGNNVGSTIQIDTTLSGGMQGSLRIALRGQATGGGGMAIAASRVDFAPASSNETYQGQVTGINGNQMGAVCSGSGGDRIQLNLQLTVDGAGNVTGTVRGSQA